MNKTCMSAAVAMLFGGLLSGCGGLEGARIRDNSSPAAAVRATFRPAAWARAEDSQRGIEIGYERFQGQSSQSLSSVQHIDLGNASVYGPDTLNNKVTLQSAHLAFTHRLGMGPHFELEPMIGIARTGLDFMVEPAVSAARPATQHFDTNFYFGITPRWRFNDVLALEGRVAGGVGVWMRYYSFDAGLLVNPVPNVALRLGYSERRHSAQLDDSLSEIDIRVRGPAVALVFDF